MVLSMRFLAVLGVTLSYKASWRRSVRDCNCGNHLIGSSSSTCFKNSGFR
jgi:hypothetical protein